MTSYLIPYVDPKKNDGEEDPMLNEYTYGDVGDRGRILRKHVKQGDFLFFHTNIRGLNQLTAYYYVEMVSPVNDAKRNPLIKDKYQNPHLERNTVQEDETIVFGHPVYSKALSRPMPITREILDKLSSKPKSIARPWVKLSDADITLLMSEIKKYEEKSFLEDTYLMTEEVNELLEKDIEEFLNKRPDFIDEDLEPFKRQWVLKSGKRIDLLFKKKQSNSYVLLEIKNTVIGRDVYNQLKDYLVELRKVLDGPVKGVIVCKGILPIAEDFYKDKMQKEKIEVYFHAWKFALHKLQL
ncbi:endonuclease NucS domain-containing protein [Heyndrickxia faecalis]|uniref:endonuclease NucS domain-containing protein n=1 Tax=Heyndrickxia faecalis TaxID=2824910 RepID=UPI003D1C146D